MFVHYHSLFAGLIVLALLLTLELPYAFGAIIIPISLLVDSGQFFGRLKRQRQPWLYALASLLQSSALSGLFAGMRFLIFGGGS